MKYTTPSNSAARYATCVLALVLCAGCAHPLGKAEKGIDNFSIVDSGILYRGAQPALDSSARRTLQEHGVKKVINLRNDLNPKEQAWAEGKDAQAAGWVMEYTNIKTDCGDVKADQLRQFLAEMDEARRENKPVFVHCQAGRDRTGLNVAIYRMVVDNWSRAKAVDEMEKHGHNGLNQWRCSAADKYLATFSPDQLKVDEAAR